MAEEEPRDEFEELLGEDNDADFPLEEEQAAGAVPDGSEEVGKGPQEEGTGEQKADAAATPRETTGDKDLLGRNEDTVDGLLDDYDNEDFFGEGDQQDGQGQAPQGEGAPQAAPGGAAGGVAPERARPEAYDMDASALGHFEEEGAHQIPFQQHQRGRGGWGPMRGGPLGPGSGGGRFGGPEGQGFLGRGGGGGGFGRGRYGFGGGWEGGRGRGGRGEGAGGGGIAGPGMGGWPIAFPPGMPPTAQRRMMAGMGMPMIPLMPGPHGTLVPDLQQQAALQQQMMRSMQGQLSTPHPSHPHPPLGGSPAPKGAPPQPPPLPPPPHGRSTSQAPHHAFDGSMGAGPLPPPTAALQLPSGPEPGEIGGGVRASGVGGGGGGGVGEGEGGQGLSGSSGAMPMPSIFGFRAPRPPPGGPPPPQLQGQQSAGAAAREAPAPPGTSPSFDKSSMPRSAANLGGPPSSSGSMGTSLQGPGHVLQYAPGRNAQQGVGEVMRGSSIGGGVSMPMHSAGVAQPAAAMRAGLTGLQQPLRQGQGVVGGGGLMGSGGGVGGGGGEVGVQGGRGGGPGGASSMLGGAGFGAGRGAGRHGGAGRGSGRGLPGGGDGGGYLGGVFSDGWNPAAVSAALMMQGGGWGGKLPGSQVGGGGGGPPIGGLPLQPPSLPGAAGMHSGGRPPHLHARPYGGLPQSGANGGGGGPGVEVGGGGWGALEGRPRSGGLTAGQPSPLMQALRPPTHKWVRPELAAAAAASGMAVEEMEQQQTQQQKSAELQRKLAIIAQKREEQTKAKAAAAAAAAAQGGGGSGAGASTVNNQATAGAAPSVPKPAAPPPKALTPQQQLELQKQELLRKQEEYMMQLRKMIAIKEAEQKAKAQAGKGPAKQGSEPPNAPQSQQHQPPLKRPSGQPGLHQDTTQGGPKRARVEPAPQQQQQQQQQQQRVGRRLQPAAAVLQQFGNGGGAAGRHEPNGNEFCEELEQAQQERRRRQQQGGGGGFMEEGLENLGAGFEGMEYAEGEGLLAQGVGLEYVEREEGVGYEGVYQEGAHYGEDLQGGGDFGGQGGGDFSGQGGDYGGQYGEAGGFGGGAGFEHDPHGLVDEGLMGGGMEEGFEEQEELLPQGAGEAAHYPEDFHGLNGLHSDLQGGVMRTRDGGWDDRGEGSEAVDRGRKDHRSKGSSGRRREYDHTAGTSGSGKHKDKAREGRGSSGSRSRHREHKDRKRHRQEHEIGEGAGLPMGCQAEQLPPPPPLPELDLRAQIEAARRLRGEDAQYLIMEEQRYGNGEKKTHRKNHKRRR